MVAKKELQKFASAIDAEMTPRRHVSRQLEHPPPAERASLARCGAGESGVKSALKEPLVPTHT